jgi:hypothetical protein
MLRFGSVAALSATLLAGLGSVASAAPRDRDDGPRGREAFAHDRDRDSRFDRDHDGDFRFRRPVVVGPVYRFGAPFVRYTTPVVAGDANERGFEQGLIDGQYDGSGGSRRPNPEGHGAYQFALDGWTDSCGSQFGYQRAYRAAYVRGYDEAFARACR